MNFKIRIMKRMMIIGFLLIGTTLIAQKTQESPNDRKEKREKVEAMKVAFITSELELSEEEAQKFWPIYNEMGDKLRVENKNQRKLAHELKEGGDKMTEADMKKRASEMLQSSINEAQIKKDYYNKIGDAIGYSKSTKLLSLEQRFKRELLNRVNNGQPNPQRPPAKE